MKARQPIRWRRYLYPEIGGRIARRTWVEFRFPFIHWLHYMTFGWTTRRLFAVTLVGVVPMAFLFMAGFNIESVSIMFPLVAAILAAVVMGWLLRPRVQFSADIPPRVERGRRFAVRYEVRNTGRRPAVDLDVGVMRFPILTEEGIGAARAPMLPAGANCIVESTGVGHYRGLYRLPPLRCHTEFPSGLWRWGRTDWSGRHLSVYPSYTRLQFGRMMEGRRIGTGRFGADGREIETNVREWLFQPVRREYTEKLIELESKDGNEHAFAVDSWTGEEKGYVPGTRSQVDLRHVPVHNEQSLSVFHNHPGGNYRLSPADVIGSMRPDVKELTAVSATGWMQVRATARSEQMKTTLREWRRRFEAAGSNPVEFELLKLEWLNWLAKQTQYGYFEISRGGTDLI